MKHHTIWILPAIFGTILICLWYGLIAVFDIPKILLPSPTDILNAAWEERETLINASAQTGFAAVVGFITSVTIGYAMSMVLASSIYLKQTLYPFILILQMTPVIVMIPIFVIWLGMGLPSITAITFIIGFFPVVANTTMGLVSTDRNLLDLFKMCGASKAQEIFNLRVPFAMPYFLTGLKIAGTLAPIGAITGDIFAGSASSNQGGIGFMTIVYNSQLKIPALFATAFTACILGFIFVGCVNLLHWYLLKNWHDSMIRKEK